ncbi:MAG: hypothetical protein ABR899_11600 [Candidatus Krumholzibacteriaceae bacterium]
MSRIMRNRSLLKAMCTICLIGILGVDPVFAGTGEPRARMLTNFEIIEKVSSEAAADIIAGLGPDQRGEVVLLNKAKSAGAVDFMLENAFVKETHEAGIKVAIEGPNVTASGKYRLSYQIIHLSISYPRSSRKLWVGPREVARSAKADVFAQLIDVATGSVLWVRETHKQYNDTIDYSRLKEVEDAQYDFTRPQHSEFRLTRLLEPLVVGGIVVGLVYLFFSNQSNK